MISFPQLCEVMTQQQKYSWFWFPRSMLSFLTIDERLIVRQETENILMSEDDSVRLWYPTHKWRPSSRDKSAFAKAIAKCIEDGDFEKAAKLSKQMRSTERE